MSAAGEVVLCETCAEGAAAAAGELRRRLGAAGLDIGVRLHACLNLCEEPSALAIQGAGRATMVFAGVAPADDLEDIVATCRAWLTAPEGWIVDARPCGRLRHCLKARIPATPRPPEP